MMKKAPEFKAPKALELSRACYAMAIAALPPLIVLAITWWVDRNGWGFVFAVYGAFFWGMAWGVGAALICGAYLILSMEKVLHERSFKKKQHTWWQNHRQSVSLGETFLLGPACPLQAPSYIGLGEDQVAGTGSDEREPQLARLLAQQWAERHGQTARLAPMRCYWQGSVPAWQAFSAQISLSCPHLCLPVHPECWDGIASLDAAIDQLQGAPAGQWILCAGSQSGACPPGSGLAASEAAVLWVLGAQGGVRVNRGEWYSAVDEQLSEVAERVLQQSDMDAPAAVCVAFPQPQAPELADLQWNIRDGQQDTGFSVPDSLQMLVSLTLAAWQAERAGMPCAWLAGDPHHTLALGMVHPHDPIH